MGGAQAGEVAARIAAEAFEDRLADDANPERELARIASEANRRIFELAREDASRSGMGTTLTGALLSDDEVSIVHVGDSRAYLLRDGELRQLTRDHSLVEELRRRGQLTSEEAEEHPQRSIITRALGPGGRRRARPAHAPGSEAATCSCSAATASRAWSARSGCTRS